ncbi:MAG: type II toxin-antitoxin system VapC family toxin [Polyangiaceae bacterium]
MDPDRLPLRALIDTGVLLRFLGDQPHDPRAPACKAFCQAMLAAGRELLIAAPTIAEVARHSGQPVPRMQGVVVVPFDDRAAELLALRIPMAKLHEAKTSTGLSLPYLKYDALIVACALRARADAIVTLDGDCSKLATGIGIRVALPSEFESKQRILPGVSLEPQPKKPVRARGRR